MRSVVSHAAIILALLVASCSGLQTQEYRREWVDLFMPPYDQVPGISFGIGCVSGTLCFMPTLMNGQGPAVFTFNGQAGGTFTQMERASNGEVFMQYIGAGGTNEAPHGLVAGFEFGLPQYIVNQSYLGDAITLPFVATVSVSADDATGKNILLANAFNAAQTLSHSTDGGVSFANVKMTGTLPTDNCTFARYQTIVDANTWFVTFGSDPHKQGPHTHQPGPPTAPQKVHLSKSFYAKKNGKGKYELEKYTLAEQRAMNGGKLREAGCPYSAAVQRTTDGGQTWTTVFSSINEGYEMDFISCSSSTNCVASADGYDDASINPAKIFATTDGTTWHETLSFTSNSTAHIYSTALSFVPGKPLEVWVAVCFDTVSGMFTEMYGSTDGGMTWPKNWRLPYVGTVTSMDFAADGNGFASAVTETRAATILRYDANGAPATPVPTYNGNYTQKACNSPVCEGSCNTTSLPQNVCIEGEDGITSFKSHCDVANGVLVQQIYIGTATCEEGFPQESALAPLNRCLGGGNGTTVEFMCGGSGDFTSTLRGIPYRR